MSTSARSEDPATNLSINMQNVLESAAKARAAQTPPRPVTQPQLFDLSNRAAIQRALVQAGVAPEDAPTKVDDAQAALRASATTPSDGDKGTAASTGSVSAMEPISLQASAPNVLGASSRRTLTIITQVIAALSVIAAIYVQISSTNGSQLAVLLVVLAIICVVVAYLTTMGFGTVNMKYGPSDETTK